MSQRAKLLKCAPAACSAGDLSVFLALADDAEESGDPWMAQAWRTLYAQGRWPALVKGYWRHSWKREGDGDELRSGQELLDGCRHLAADVRQKLRERALYDQLRDVGPLFDRLVTRSVELQNGKHARVLDVSLGGDDDRVIATLRMPRSGLRFYATVDPLLRPVALPLRIEPRRGELTDWWE